MTVPAMTGPATTGPATTGPAVVQVTPYYPPHLGGVEVAVQIIATSLAATRPVEVLTSTRGAAGRPKVERSGLLTVRRLRCAEFANTPITPALASRLLRLGRDTVVHVHIAQAYAPEVVWITSRLRRRPFIAHFHLDVDPSGPAGVFLAAYKRLVLARVLRAAASVIALSDEQARFIAERYRVPRERIAVVPNGVPRVDDGADPHAGHRPADVLRLLFVGRLSVQKNLRLLVDALKAMEQPAELAIVGDGPGLTELTSQVDELGLNNVRLAGRAERSELSGWYRWADVFVLSSHKEGMPLAALEAMSFGLPIVATDVPGLRELCADAGVLVPSDPLAFARALDSLAVDSAARQRLADQSLAACLGLGWENSLELIEGLYQEVAR